MTLYDIEKRLREVFQPLNLSLLDESESHRGHYDNPADLSHIHIQMVSNTFDGLSLVARQRAVYQELAPAFEVGLHAVRMTLKAPSEVL